MDWPANEPPVLAPKPPNVADEVGAGLPKVLWPNGTEGEGAAIPNPPGAGVVAGVDPKVLGVGAGVEPNDRGFAPYVDAGAGAAPKEGVAVDGAPKDGAAAPAPKLVSDGAGTDPKVSFMEELEPNPDPWPKEFALEAAETDSNAFAEDADAA